MKKSMRCIAAVLMAVVVIVIGGCGSQPAATAPAASASIVIHEVADAEKVTEAESTLAASESSAAESAVSESASEELVQESEEQAVLEEPGAEELSESSSAETSMEPEAVTESSAVQEEPGPQITEEPEVQVTEMPESSGGIMVEEDGEYSDKEHVALYIHTYGKLPSNYVTKKEAEAAGWDSGAGNLYKVLPGKSIGGGRFGNYEGLLPEASGRKYYECDINYNPQGKTSGKVSRGPERIVYSNDGLIFYTEDHYRSFEQLYG